MSAADVELVLGAYPNSRGFAFVLFEGEYRIVDWGISEARADLRPKRGAAQIGYLLRKFRPDCLVLREEAGSRQRDLFGRLLDMAHAQGTPIALISRKQVRGTPWRSTKATRQAIATELIRRFSVLRSFDPGPRKIWNSEKRQMGLFDAVALVVAFFASRTEGAD